MVELSGTAVSANFGLETNLPFNRTTEQKAVSSNVSKRVATVMPRTSAFSSTSIIKLFYTVFFQYVQYFRKINS